MREAVGNGLPLRMGPQQQDRQDNDGGIQPRRGLDRGEENASGPIALKHRHQVTLDVTHIRHEWKHDHSEARSRVQQASKTISSHDCLHQRRHWVERELHGFRRRPCHHFTTKHIQVCVEHRLVLTAQVEPSSGYLSCPAVNSSCSNGCRCVYLVGPSWRLCSMRLKESDASGKLHQAM